MAQPFFVSPEPAHPATTQSKVARTLLAVAAQRNHLAAELDQIIPHDGRGGTPTEANSAG